jgi:hypothetical protein
MVTAAAELELTAPITLGHYVAKSAREKGWELRAGKGFTDTGTIYLRAEVASSTACILQSQGGARKDE